jgi:hypothetical protein
VHLVGFTIELIATTHVCSLFEYAQFDDSEHYIDIIIWIWTCQFCKLSAVPFLRTVFYNKEALNYFSVVLPYHWLQQKSWRNSLHQSNKAIFKDISSFSSGQDIATL